MEDYGLLDPKAEEELYRTRLLNVEEKPFKRISKRVSTFQRLIRSHAYQAATPPPSGNEAEGQQEATESKEQAQNTEVARQVAQLREDITLDFAAFDASIARLQFLLNSNEQERGRYAAQKISILEKCQNVRDNTAALRTQLDEARETLEQRKKFDELTEKITSNRLLRPRAEQQANLQKLEEECRQLEEESETYAVTWRERREQFDKIMGESERLRRLIRDEKEEVERREGMDDEGHNEGGGGADGADEGQTPRPGIASGNATPHPDSGMVAKAIMGGQDSGDAETPHAASTLGGRTPARESPAPDAEGLKARPDVTGSFSQAGSHAPSRDASPARAEGAEDVEMQDAPQPAEATTQLEGMPRITVDGQDGLDEAVQTD